MAEEQNTVHEPATATTENANGQAPQTPPNPPAPKPGPPSGSAQGRKDAEELAAYRALGLKPSQLKVRLDAGRADGYKVVETEQTVEQLQAKVDELTSAAEILREEADAAGYERGKAEVKQQAVRSLLAARGVEPVGEGDAKDYPALKFIDWTNVPDISDSTFVDFLGTLSPTVSSATPQSANAASYGVGGATQTPPGGLDSGAEMYARRHQKQA